MKGDKGFVKFLACAILSAFCLIGFGCMHAEMIAYAETSEMTEPAQTVTPVPVSVGCINYEESYILVNPGDNTKVYYSDSKKKTWYQLEGDRVGDYFKMDISWISEKKDYQLNLKGSDDEKIVTITLPKYNGKLKVKFNKADGILTFTNEDAKTFEWRKYASTGEWNSGVPVDMTKPDPNLTEFLQEIEMLRAKGGKISVRQPQVAGESADTVGKRPSRTVTVTISKRGSAPSVKVNANRMNLNTKDTMEYYIDTVDDQLQTPPETSTGWKTCDKKMKVSDLSENAIKNDIVVAFRKAETERAGHSKYSLVEIPRQASAPVTQVTGTVLSEKKFALKISDASYDKPYQYVAVKAGRSFDIDRASWRKVNKPKDINFSLRSYPVGSKIYVRLMGNNKSKKSDLKLPSDHTVIDISYKAETDT